VQNIYICIYATSITLYKECNKVSIASTCCSALACAEQLLRTTIVRWWSGSHGGKQRCLLLYWASSRASSVTASWVDHVPWGSETPTSSNTSQFLETSLSSSKMKLHTSSTWVKKGHHASCTCANLDTISRTQGRELGLSKGLQFEDFFVLLYYVCPHCSSWAFVCSRWELALPTFGGAFIGGRWSCVISMLEWASMHAGWRCHHWTFRFLSGWKKVRADLLPFG